MPRTRTPTCLCIPPISDISTRMVTLPAAATLTAAMAWTIPTLYFPAPASQRPGLIQAFLETPQQAMAHQPATHSWRDLMRYHIFR